MLIDIFGTHHESIRREITNVELGFADALHASYKDCISVAYFDDKKIVRRAKLNGLMHSGIVPK